MKELVVGALQLPTLGVNTSRLEFYIKKAKERDCSLLLFGEYVTNHFFKELINMPKNMVKEQTNSHIAILKRFSKEYDITFVAPIVEVKGKRYYKKIVKISPKSLSYYTQQLLINYPHWNEEEFFSNPIKPLSDPLSFTINGFKVGVMFGFEIHFDKLWQYILQKRVDLVLLPTATTFNSQYRWRELISMRAFLNNCYILRANRVGDFIEDGVKWHFYGDSMLVNPNGVIEMNLEDKESMLIESVSKEVLSESRRGWRFRHHLAKRGEI
ncbi:MAG: carbon-nitrogen hydrolase family protein [Epsilonproteobacteria bacterium]|nr:carbon-nitrogen hydrolase family protein [Campylobacterota bacterium]